MGCTRLRTSLRTSLRHPPLLWVKRPGPNPGNPSNRVTSTTLCHSNRNLLKVPSPPAAGFLGAAPRPPNDRRTALSTREPASAISADVRSARKDPPNSASHTGAAAGARTLAAREAPETNTSVPPTAGESDVAKTDARSPRLAVRACAPRMAAAVGVRWRTATNQPRAQQNTACAMGGGANAMWRGATRSREDAR